MAGPEQSPGRRPTLHDVANEAGVSIKTVEYYKQNIKEKLNLKGAAELTQFAVEVAKGAP